MPMEETRSILLNTTPLTIFINGNHLLTTPAINILPKQRIALIGENGSGKTTLLKTLAKLRNPKEGNIYYPTDSTRSRLSKLLFSKQPWVCYLHQQPYLFDGSVLQNINYNKRVNQHQQPLLEKLKIIPLMHKHVSMLSGGERQRVAIARALIQEPKILLLDEVIANLDQQMLPSIIEALDSFIDQGGSYLITFHHNNRLSDLCKQEWQINQQQLYLEIL